jgi:predicted metal-dependent hydrolase
MTLTLLIVLLYKSLSPPTKVATVDVTGIVREFMHSQDHRAPSNETEKQMKTFGHQLEEALQATAKAYHVVILPREAVITGSADLTALVKQQLASNLPASANKALW